MGKKQVKRTRESGNVIKKYGEGARGRQDPSGGTKRDPFHFSFSKMALVKGRNDLFNGLNLE